MTVVSDTEPRRAVTGDEMDAFGRVRHWIRWRPGGRKAAKRRANRRERAADARRRAEEES